MRLLKLFSIDSENLGIIMKQEDFLRVFGRIVYCPRLRPGSNYGASYRDLILDRYSDHFCLIVNESLDKIDWGILKLPNLTRNIFKKLIREVSLKRIFQELMKEIRFLKIELYQNFDRKGNHENW